MIAVIAADLSDRWLANAVAARFDFRSFGVSYDAAAQTAAAALS
jgi:hypothetical protein